jgi:ubiquinol-cytochrome c reductase iron-sulfur subunit
MSPRAAERWTAALFGASTLASVGLLVVYWRGGQPQLEGALLAVILGGIGAGIVVWAKRFMPDAEVTEERGQLASTDEEVDAFRRDFESGEAPLRRRGLLVAMGGTALAALGAALLPPIRSLGPRPGKDLKVTAYGRRAMRVVTADGEPVRPEDLPVDGVVTVWPEAAVGSADAPTLLIRLRDDQSFRPRRGREDWTVQDVVAYSKLCTHTGCPVGLYQAEQALLLCPCHQSTFDVLDGARPVFGPAARSLPQLPLDVDDDGYLVATGDFSDPVGPGFFDRGRD